MQAGRSIGRLCSYLIELHNPSFSLVEREHSIPGRITILKDIMVRVKLREAPLRPPKTDYCSDLRQVQHTLEAAERVLERLRYTARRIEGARLLLGNKLTTKEEEYLAGIKSDTTS